MEKIQFLNTYVNHCSMDECVEEIERLISVGGKHYIIAVNADVIMKIEHDEKLKAATDEADMVIVDGKPLIWIAKKHKKPIREKISGSDLVPILCRKAGEKGYSVFILGGKEGIAERAKSNLEKDIPDINVVGTYAPPFGFETNEEEIGKVIQAINEVKPDILLVCFGCPKQEKFVFDHIRDYEAKISICAGATVDFLAGNVKRAPKWMSNVGLEWLYRFFKEPRRLFRRYFIDDIKIFRLARKYKPSRKERKAKEHD